MNPPDKAIVLSVDEKSQIQALDRMQPILPLRPGLSERQTHDYKRHGTTTLFAALNVLEGTVIGECQPRHRHQEFLRFLDRIDQSIHTNLDIHLVLDNYGTHKHPEVKTWLAARPRYHVHFTPTSSSWFNQVECCFAEITRKRIRRGTFRSVRELNQSDPRLHPDLQQQSATLSVGRKREPDHPKSQSLSTNVRNSELEIEKRLQSIIAALLLKTSAFGASILESDAHVRTCRVE
jgi:transposase